MFYYYYYYYFTYIHSINDGMCMDHLHVYSILSKFKYFWFCGPILRDTKSKFICFQ